MFLSVEHGAWDWSIRGSRYADGGGVNRDPKMTVWLIFHFHNSSAGEDV
jgi:hypothetical protein